MQKRSHQSPKSAKLRPPRRLPNRQARQREYLTVHEIESLQKAARAIGRHGHRDAALILLLFRHAFRVSEAIILRWEQIDFKQGLMHVVRIKNGLPSTHPLRAKELRALRQLQRDYPNSQYVFTSERGAPLTARSIHLVLESRSTK